MSNDRDEMDSGGASDEENIENPIPGVDQSVIADKIQVYLSQKNDQDVETVSKEYFFAESLCSGLTQLYLYSKYLSVQPIELDDQGQVIKRDDYEWFKRTIEHLTRWDESSAFPQDIDTDILRLISLIRFFQSPQLVMGALQGDFPAYFSDTKGRVLHNEFDIASLLRKNELRAVLEECMEPLKMFIISSHTHDIGMIKINDGFLYDANDPKGEKIATSIEEIVDWVFAANAKDFSQNESMTFPCPIGIRKFGFGATEKNLDTKNILEKINPDLTVIPSYASYGMTSLLTAASINSTASVEYFIERGADVNEKQFNGLTALHLLSASGNVKLIETLIQKGADINQVDVLNRTPLMLAAERGQVEVMKLLISKGADLNQAYLSPSGKDVDFDKDVACVWFETVNEDKRAELEKKYPDSWPDYISETNQFMIGIFPEKDGGKRVEEYTIAELEGIQKNYPVVYMGWYLDDLGKDKIGYTALHFAAEKGNVEMVKVLCEAGAKTLISSTGGKPYDVTTSSQIQDMLLAAEEKANTKANLDVYKVFLLGKKRELSRTEVSHSSYSVNDADFLKKESPRKEVKPINDAAISDDRDALLLEGKRDPFFDDLDNDTPSPRKSPRDLEIKSGAKPANGPIKTDDKGPSVKFHK